MTVQVSYPGVYIDEVPSTVRTIIGVPTAVAAFVGPASRGPVDEAGHISSWSEFDRIYGGLSSGSLMAYAVSHYYANGGSEAEIVRVAARSAVSQIALGNDVVLEARKPGTAGDQLVARVDYPADATTYTLQIKGDPATYTIKVDAAQGDPGSLEEQLAKSQSVRPAAGTKRGKPPASPPAAGADPFADPTLHRGQGGRDGALRSHIDLPAKTADDKDVLVILEVRDPGTWGDGIVALVDHDTIDPNDKTLYNLTVRDTDPVRGVEETWRNVSTEAGSPNRLDRVLADSRLVRVRTGTPLDVRPLETGVDAGGNPKSVTAKEGADGAPVLESEIAGSPTSKSGIYALLDTDIFTILCVPPVEREREFAATLMTAAAKLCLDRRAVLLVDAPRKWTTVEIAVAKKDVITPGAGTAEAKNAAVYFPWVRLPNAFGRLEEFPPCGAVAGVWARTDGQRNVAKAPAGTETGLSGVQELVVKMTDLQNGRLNPLGINCLRTFPGLGSVVWGARTRKGDDRLTSEWKYVPVRRTALFIEESLYRGTQWVVFEPNDEPLWAAIRLNVGAFMNSLWRQGMFQGRTPQEAYLVKCDAENNPQNDIDRGIVNILVGFAPLKPAEFVLVHIQQLSPAPQV